MRNVCLKRVSLFVCSFLARHLYHKYSPDWVVYSSRRLVRALVQVSSSCTVFIMQTEAMQINAVCKLCGVGLQHSGASSLEFLG